MKADTFEVTANLVDLYNDTIIPSRVVVVDGIIESINPAKQALDYYLLPGFVDAHVHIESSMLVPAEFARLAVRHGTVATVSDPHEIANVCGVEGVDFMIENGKTTPFRFFFGAPSCVPATLFETSGALLSATHVDSLLARQDIWYLSEMMNFPGAINGDPEVLAKIEAAKKHGKPVDGHAPLLSGDNMRQYAARGITTDHECVSLAEALEKIDAGMHIIIREGSAACNFNALHPLLRSHPGWCMFGSDDKHPDSLLTGHINQLASRAVKHGHNIFDVLRAACLNPVQHYQLPVGGLKQGDFADFILVKDLKNFEVLKTWIGGQLVAENGTDFLPSQATSLINYFNCQPVSPLDLRMPAEAEQALVIKANDGQIVTGKITESPLIIDGFAECDIRRDLLKIAVINRYKPAKPSLGFISGFGLSCGAMASSVAHDSHNIVAVGCSDEDLAAVINKVVECNGGIAACADAAEVKCLALPIAGLMSNLPAEDVANHYTELDNFVKNTLRSLLTAPFMTLSFMALPVIPSLKITDMGLFDADNFAFAKVWKSYG